MSVTLTPRMKNWIRLNGVHIAIATKIGFPTVIVVNTTAIEENNTISISLTPSQINQVKNVIQENPNVAVAPGNLGSVRAPYQLKGLAKLVNNTLEITVEEIYCTKPGAEAGIRLDTMGYENMKDYEESRWHDIMPPTKQNI